MFRGRQGPASGERSAGVLALLVLALGACSGQSDSVLPGESTASGSGGGAAAPGTGGTSSMPSAGSGNTPAPVGGVGGSSVGGGGSAAEQGGSGNLPLAGAPATGGTPGAGGSTEPATGCQPQTRFTLAVRGTFPVSWPATLGTTAGTGNFELLNLYRFTANGNVVTGTASPCGSALPPLTFSGLIGGGNSLIEIPDSVWDTPGFPAFESSGTIGGWEPGSSLEVPAAGALVGLTMADPTGPWPESFTDVTPVDTDADGNAGITAIPASGDGFTSPPVSIVGPRVDQVHIVTRTASGLSGAFTSCTEMEGEATLAFFDNHVVGCRTVEGDICNATQTDFVDVNRTIFTASPGTFRASILPEGATCSDARALP